MLKQLKMDLKLYKNDIWGALAIIAAAFLVGFGVVTAVMLLSVVGFANMWLAVIADVGVCVVAILNAMRAFGIKD